MSRTFAGSAAMALALVAANPAASQNDPSLVEVRRQIEALQQRRNEDAQRMRDLEERLRRAEDTARRAIEQAKTLPTVTPAATAGPGSKQTAAAGGGFNPGISVILDGKLGYFQRDPDTYSIAGFPRADEGPGQRGIFLGEAEVNAFANIDDLFFGNLTVAFVKDGSSTSVELEEAYIQTMSLPWGLQATAGQMFSDIGYLNGFHAHADDFADRPLVYRAFLADQFKDPGVRLTWVAPTDLYLRVGGEVFRGDSFPSSGARNRGYGAASAFVRVGGDIGTELSYQSGLSWLTTDARDRVTADPAAPDVFGGSTDVGIAHLVFKWAPDGNPVQRNLKWQTETFRNSADGDYAGRGPFDRTDYGLYSQLVYQFVPKWRTGYRYDWLTSGSIDTAAFGGSTLDDRGHDPSRHSAMIEYDHSEFSRLRLQYNYDRSRPDQIDHQVLLQYTATMGAHPAHAY